jgi:Transglutaminase-like superfamily
MKTEQPDMRRIPCVESLEAHYFMSPLIFASVTRHGVVLLDLKHNRYLGLGYSDALVLSKHVQGFPRLDQRAEFGVLPEVDHSDDAAILETFMRRGIVTTRHTRRGNIVSNVVSLQGSLVSIGDEITAPAVSPSRHVPAFLYSLICSSACLRCVPLRFIVQHVYGRHSSAIAKGCSFSVSKASALVDAFRLIRPYFFLAKENCLLHALTLVNFLAYYGEFPLWVFGVSSDPWTAHSWVQQDHYLLDCNPENVCGLEPILAI